MGIRNWLKERRIRKRDKKALAKWNADLSWIGQKCAESDDEYADFKWVQLVWQEIWMWSRQDKQVDLAEFNWICERRAFDPVMRTYLYEMVCYLGLGEGLKAEGRDM